MKGAILEVLLVSAEGIDHTSLIGKQEYHVIVECGNQTCRSKTISGRDKVFWNEKISFALTSSELETLGNLKLKIINEEYLADGEYVGETIIFLKGIISEGNHKGVIELLPAPYNVVIEDDAYKGQMMIGLKFIPNEALQMKRNEQVQEENDVGKISICKTIFSFWQLRWWRILFSQMSQNYINNNKHN